MLTTIIIFIVVLSILVFAHELGHFFVARKFGVRAEEFGLGFPPRVLGIYKSKKGRWRWVGGGRAVEDAEDTVYSINWFPLGGFVKIKGEDGPTPDEIFAGRADEDSFSARPIWQRASILSAGVTMNIVLAAVLISIGLMIGLPQALDNISPRAEIIDKNIQVMQVMPESPAKRAGIMAGDVIVSINGEKFSASGDLQKYVDKHTGEKLNYEIRRGQAELVMEVAPRLMEDVGRGGIGVAIAETGIVKYPWYLAIWEGLKTTFVLAWAIIAAFYELLKNLILGQATGVEVAGPVGIAALTGQVARMGFVYVLQFTALLSINLAIINFLPFPALDGGRVLFLIIEKIKGSPVKREIETAIHNIGFALLMLLILIITYKDIARFSDKFKILWEKIF